MAVLRAGYAVAIINNVMYTLGTLKNISVSPNYTLLSQLGGGNGLVESASVSCELESMPTATKSALIGEHATIVWIQEELLGNAGLVFKVTELNDVVFEPPAESGVAKGAGDTTITTLSLSGTAFLDIDDEWQNITYYSILSDAIEYIEDLIEEEEENE